MNRAPAHEAPFNIIRGQEDIALQLALRQVKFSIVKPLYENESPSYGFAWLGDFGDRFTLVRPPSL